MIIIDRLEEKWAVLEYNHMTFHLPKSILPKEAREGDVLNITVTVDHQATAKQKDNIDTLIKDLFQD